MRTWARASALALAILFGTVAAGRHADQAEPLTGWVVVRAPRLTADAILSALARGDFYASTGVEGYVRARVRDSNGLMAWTQPVFLEGGQGQD